MCDVCHQHPCHPRCPNAPDPPEIYKCAHCHEPIVAGDEYVELDGKYYHREECIEDCALDLLLKECGATQGVARTDDSW